jgi:hypothetical protein
MKALLHSGRAILTVFALLFLAAVACVLAPGVASSDATAPCRTGELRDITIGAAAASRYRSEPEYAAILGSEFSPLQAENEMKFGLIHPRPDCDPNPYDFAGGDAVWEVIRLQAHSGLGSHRPALMDSAVLQRARLGAALGRESSVKAGVFRGWGRAGAVSGRL